MKSRVTVFWALLLVVVLMATIASPALAAKPIPPPLGGIQVQLPGNKIPQFVDPLPMLDVVNLNAQSNTGISTVVAGTGELVLNMQTIKANIMPSTFVPATGIPYAGTWTFAYLVNTPSGTQAPLYETPVGPVIVATRGVPTQIRYVNNLEASNNTIRWRDWTDQTLHSAFHQAFGEMMPIPTDSTNHYMGPVLAVPHLHGGEDPAVIDGGPEAWFGSNVPGTTPISNTHGPAYYTSPDVAGVGANPAADNEAIYRYPNTQEASPLWFHDHLLGGTRLNATYGGLAGAYDIIDPDLSLPTGLLPLGLDTNSNTVNDADEYLVPLVIQDRMFDTNGQLFFPNVGVNPEHPYWVPEFVGDTIIANGKVWPYLNVDQKRYRFYAINGSNSRAYDMFLQDQASGVKYPMWVISTDGGYLDAPALIDPNATGAQVKAGVQKSLMMMPGERYEIIIDFAGIPAGTTLILRNTAPTVNGNPKASTDGRIMQFRVTANAPVDNSYNPATLTPIRTGSQTIVRLPGAPGGPAISITNVDVTRLLTLNEVVGAGGPLEALVNNSKWMGIRPDMMPIDGSTEVNGNWLTEFPEEGDMEVWEIINLTMDSHPIHLHGVQFQLIDRQAFDMNAYMMTYNMAFPGNAYIPGYGPPLNYFTGNPRALGGNPDAVMLGLPKPPLTYEAGWKDTVIMHPGEKTRIAVRIAPQDVPLGTVGSFTFNPSAPVNPDAPIADQKLGVYVWHCHITDHEDNEMMRPDVFVPLPSAVRTYIQGVDY
ncbi:MAG: multicopper oxidase domain-containing protein [Dehalococcoidales bacterium]|nr:multicopper oxidase domain-containing protein [Dehalococcoidales bacterium]